MSLLQNQDFVLYQLRAGYLSSIRDGVGERLINADTTVLNNAAFRAAGWAPNAADLKRAYSPPIPTAVTSEYFRAPRSFNPRNANRLHDGDEERGLVTGGGASTDNVARSLHTRRKRRKEQLEEEDSSDLSDESDEEGEAAQRLANQIQFTKVPLRTRAGSSPIPNSALHKKVLTSAAANGAAEGPAVTITSPSRPSDSRLRRGSSGAIEPFSGRPRRDTVTSSEMSSENEFEAVAFQRRKAGHRTKPSGLRIDDDEGQTRVRLEALDEGDESVNSSLPSEFSGTPDSGSLLSTANSALVSPPTALATTPPVALSLNTSPGKSKHAPAALQALPPPRPISFVPPVSALTQALQANDKQPSNPLQRFAILSTANDPKYDPSYKPPPGQPEMRLNPLYIRIYCPFSKAAKPLELLLKHVDDNGEAVTVSEAIGFALWRYQEEKAGPAFSPKQMNVNCWVLRMCDDGEVDDEFDPLARNKPLVDFASNNKRGMRPRAREKPWDEFGLVEAGERETADNEKLTPKYSREAAAALAVKKSPEPLRPPPQAPVRVRSFRNPITGPSFAPTATRKDSSTLLDAPATTTHSTPRTGVAKTVTVHYTDENAMTRHVPVPCTTDTYIAEIFDKVCHDFGLEKAIYVLRVSGSMTVAPTDHTVEALGAWADLDLARRRFVGDGVFGLAGSPGSSLPNAPLIISTGGAPKKTKKSERNNAANTGPQTANLRQQRHDPLTGLVPGNYYRRYAVTRKQPMSFSSSAPRILALDYEYIYIMPGESTGGTKSRFEAPGKTVTVPFSGVLGSKVSKKHARMFRLVVERDRETKRYDFETSSPDEAVEIVEEILNGVARWQESAM